MSPPPVTREARDAVVHSLAEVFRGVGYHGASMTQLAAATGLGRASLYHRFPGGKNQMAQEAVEHVHRWFGAIALAPLRESGPVGQRVRRMAAVLREFYANGRNSCLLDTMSVAPGAPEHQPAVRAAFDAWLGAMAAAAREAGLSPAVARQRAEDAIIRIEGALVLARISGDTGPFERTLAELPAILTRR